MQTIKAYLYPNTVEVQVFDPGIFTTRNRVVYSRPIKVYQGIDNPIQVVFRNQDQKPVDLTGYEIIASIQDPVNQVGVVDYTVDFADITTGLGTFVVDYTTVTGLEQRIYKLTFRSLNLSNSAVAPLYIDDNYTVPLDLEVLPAYYSGASSGPTGGSGGGGSGGGSGGYIV